MNTSKSCEAYEIYHIFVNLTNLFVNNQRGFYIPHSKEKRGKYEFKKTGIRKSKGSCGYLLMNRLETFLMNNFDTDIQEVKEFEMLLAVLPLMAFILLDSIFKFIH